MKLIADYQNGNTNVKLYSNGTREMVTEDDEFDLDFPVSMDLSITKNCDGNCPYCYLGCSTSGEHGDILSPKFLETIQPGTEIAINLNSCNHPQLLPFLQTMRKRNIIVNGSINQVHFMRYHAMLKRLCDNKLLWGLGISLHKPTVEFVRLVKEFDNAVIHVINGIFDADDIEMLRDNDLKILILGYKPIGRGADYISENNVVIGMRQQYLHDVLPTMINKFALVSFDNLAIKQLDVKRILTDDQWETFYQGDEGSCSMYVDLVNSTFGVSSLCADSDMSPIMDDIKDMFAVVKQKARAV